MIDKGGILVIDDFIDKDYQEDIKDYLMGDYLYNNEQFPWYYIDDVTAAYEEGNQGRPGLSHVYVEYNEDKTSEIVSDFHEVFLPLLSKACQVLQVPTANIVQGRSFLQFPLNLESTDDDTPHIDLDEGERHIVVLYYVVTSDGDTVIYNERTESDTYTVKQRVTPKQGRVVIFDGGLYHTAQQALKNIRCIVNYNLAWRFSKTVDLFIAATSFKPLASNQGASFQLNPFPKVLSGAMTYQWQAESGTSTAHFDQSSSHCGTWIHRAWEVSANTGLAIKLIVKKNRQINILGIYLIEIGLL